MVQFLKVPINMIIMIIVIMTTQVVIFGKQHFITVMKCLIQKVTMKNLLKEDQKLRLNS